MLLNEPPGSSSGRMSGREQSRQAGTWRWFCELSLATRVFAALAALFLLFCALFAEENWRGRRAWENCRRDLEAKGVELDWLQFVPPPVPDEQNFALTPFFAPLFDFNPKPRSAGQTIWRDMAAHDGVMNFAAVLVPTNDKGGLPPTLFDGRMTDLEGVLSSLRNQTNSAAVSASGVANRTQTATALLGALEGYNAVLEEIRTASQRPHSRFKIEYNPDDPISILLPHYLVIQRLNRLLEVRASAALALGKTDAAFADVKLMFYLAGATDGEPFMMTVMASGSELKRTEQIIWEGLAARHWSDAQLQDFQTRLGGFALLKGLARGLRAERAAFGNAAFRYLRGHKNALRDWASSDGAAASVAYLLAGPSGWLYQEQATYHRLFDERLWPGFDPDKGRVFPRVVEENREALAREFRKSVVWHHTGMSQLLLANLPRMFQRTAIGQDRANQTMVACALERYRLAKGKYPDGLEALIPQFASKVPADVCDGQPLKYRLLPDGDFVLYGVGWNEKDDGGTTLLAAEGTDFVPKAGDWVWPAYPKE